MKNVRILKVDLENRKQVKQFLDLPFLMYREIPQWVPPLAIEARLMLNPKRHPFYKHSQAAFLIVFEGDQHPIRRIAVINNCNYNAYNQEETAFFIFLEQTEAFHALFQASFEWAKQQGLNKMIGPNGFKTLDGMGLLVRGFEHRPAYGQPYNHPYYAKFIKAEGFSPSGEIVSGYLDAQNMHFPDGIHQRSEILQQRRGLKENRPAALQRTKGRLFPFGWLDLLLELRHTKWINLNGTRIVPKYRSLGNKAILFNEMDESVAERSYRFADLV